MYTAKRLPVHTGPAAWNSILPQRVSTEQLTENKIADYVVIGAGFAGISAARKLSQINPNARIVILEAHEIAESAAGRNSGFMIDLPHELTSEDYAGQQESQDRDLIALNRKAISFAQEAVQDYGINPNYFDPVGKINGAVSSKGDKANLGYAQHLKGLNESYECLDQRQMKEITGSDYYSSGLYTPGTVMLQPAGYVREFVDGFGPNITIHENSPVLSFDKQGSDWFVKTQQGSVSAGCVILANNGHLESFGFKKNRLMHIMLFASMTKELGRKEIQLLGGQSRWGITPSDPMGTTVRRIDIGQGGNRIVTRTCAEFRPNMQTTQGSLERAKKVMRRKFDDRFPSVAGLDMEYSWAGHLCLSVNSVSVTGKLDDGLYAACCQNGLGTTRGTLAGIGVAEMSCGETSDITRFFSNEPEPKKLPPPPFSTLGANIYLKLKERNARYE